MADRGRVAPGRPRDRTTRSQRRARRAGRRISLPCRFGAVAGRRSLHHRLLRRAAPLLAALALAEALRAGAVWAATAANPGTGTGARGEAAATAAAGAGTGEKAARPGSAA